MALMDCTECGKPVNSLSPENCEHCGAITRQESTRPVETREEWKVYLGLLFFILGIYAWGGLSLDGQMRSFFLGLMSQLIGVILLLPSILSFFQDQQHSSPKKWCVGIMVLIFWLGQRNVSRAMQFPDIFHSLAGPIFLGMLVILFFLDPRAAIRATTLKYVEDWKQTAKLHRESKWRRVIFRIVVAAGISLCICLYVYSLLNPSS